MNINFEYYKVFYNVAKNRNITKTANDLMISQPAISKSIKNLEEQLGCVLFTRGKAGVALTEEGNILFNEIKNAIEIMNTAEEKIEEINNLDRGVLNIGINNTLAQKYLLPYLNEFTKKYPNIKIRILTGPPLEFMNMAKNSLIDIIILHLPYEIPSIFETVKLKEIHDVFVASNEYDYLKDKKISLSELNNYPLILLAKGSNGRYHLDRLCANKDVSLSAKFELASYSLVTEFIKAGTGIGVLTKEFIKKEINDGRLFPLDVDFELPHRHIGAIYLKNKYLNKASREFLNLLINKNL